MRGVRGANAARGRGATRFRHTQCGARRRCSRYLGRALGSDARGRLRLVDHAAAPDEVPPPLGAEGAAAKAIAGVAADAAAAVARERAAAAPRLEPGLLVTRELSLLAFQWRVFEEVHDPANPLLERVRFLSIVASNLDEFFMIRVAGLEQQVAAGITEASTTGSRPRSSWPRSPGGPPAHQGARRVLAGGAAAAARRGRRPRPRSPAARSETGRLRAELLRRDGDAGPHPARVRPGPPVPAHLEPEPQPGGAGRGRGDRALRARQGSGHAPPPGPDRPAVGRARRLGSPTGGRLRLAGAAHRRPRRPALPAPREGVSVPRHARRRDGAAGDGGRRSARLGGARRPGAALRLGRPPGRDAGHAQSTSAASWSRTWRSTRATCRRSRGRWAGGDRGARLGRAAIVKFPAFLPRPPARLARGEGPLRRHPAAGCAATTPSTPSSRWSTSSAPRRATPTSSPSR